MIFRRAFIFFVVIFAVSSASANDFVPLTPFELQLLAGEDGPSVNVGKWLIQRREGRADPKCFPDKINGSCHTSLFFAVDDTSVLSSRGDSLEFVGFAFYVPPGIGWAVEDIALYPQNDSPECVLVSLSEEVQGSGIAVSGDRRNVKLCVTEKGLMHKDKFPAEVTPMTPREVEIMLRTDLRFPHPAHDQSVPSKAKNGTPWDIRIFNVDATSGCGLDTSSYCRDVIYGIVADKERSMQFGFQSRKGFSWDIEDIRTFVQSDSTPVCALLTFGEDVRTKKLEEAHIAKVDAWRATLNGYAQRHEKEPPEPLLIWPRRMQHVCVSPQGFVEIR